MLGDDVGLLLGELLGEFEGLVVGLLEGLEVGVNEGLKLGDEVGEDVGLNVGLAVGLDVGCNSHRQDLSKSMKDKKQLCMSMSTICLSNRYSNGIESILHSLQELTTGVGALLGLDVGLFEG